MNERIARKRRRAGHWRERAARVLHNEHHQEWSRRRRYWWRSMHSDPRLRALFPALPPQPNDGWWEHAIARAEPAMRHYTRNALSQCGARIQRIDGAVFVLS